MYPLPSLRNTTNTSGVPQVTLPDFIHVPSPLSNRCPGFGICYSLAFLCNFITFVSLNDEVLCFPLFGTSWKGNHPLCTLLPDAFPLSVVLVIHSCLLQNSILSTPYGIPVYEHMTVHAGHCRWTLVLFPADCSY